MPFSSFGILAIAPEELCHSDDDMPACQNSNVEIGCLGTLVG